MSVPIVIRDKDFLIKKKVSLYIDRITIIQCILLIGDSVMIKENIENLKLRDTVTRICDECGKEGEYNPNFRMPNDWVRCCFECNTREKKNMELCSKECLLKYVSSDAIGNDIGHNLKDSE